MPKLTPLGRSATAGAADSACAPGANVISATAPTVPSAGGRPSRRSARRAREVNIMEGQLLGGRLRARWLAGVPCQGVALTLATRPGPPASPNTHETQCLRGMLGAFDEVGGKIGPAYAGVTTLRSSSTRPCSTMSRATPMALTMARADDDPCEMM